MWTYFFFLEGKTCVLLIENIVILPYYCLIDLYAKFFFLWLVTFAKVECCQITETCGINWEDSSYGRAYLDFSPKRFVSCGSPLMRDSTFCSNPVSNNLRQGLPNGIVALLGNI